MLDDKAAVDFLGEPRIRSGRCGKQIANAMALNLNNRLHFATGMQRDNYYEKMVAFGIILLVVNICIYFFV